MCHIYLVLCPYGHILNRAYVKCWLDHPTPEDCFEAETVFVLRQPLLDGKRFSLGSDCEQEILSLIRRTGWVVELNEGCWERILRLNGVDARRGEVFVCVECDTVEIEGYLFKFQEEDEMRALEATMRKMNVEGGGNALVFVGTVEESMKKMQL